MATIKDLYQARISLMSLRTTLENTSFELAERLDESMTATWDDTIDNLHIIPMQDKLQDLVSEIGNQILKVEHKILKHWALPDMRTVLKAQKERDILDNLHALERQTER